jgi:Carboxypeptidase regulatory-like domain/TonB-dependent Receptor Plug Domain/TonB dependent receptor
MTIRLLARLEFASAALLLLASVSAPAQFGASLSGTVQDPSKDVISGATVTLTNQDTQQSQTKVTGDQGFFQFTNLPAAQYSLMVDAATFKKYTSENIAIAAESPRTYDVTLAIGGKTESVTVNAEDTVALQTSDASVGTVIDSAQLEKVPTYGRDPYNLLRTAPGVTGDGARGGNGNAVFLPNSVGPGGSNFGIAQAENTVQISANGMRVTDNNYLLDGVSVNSLGYGGAAVVTPNIEAIGSIAVVSTSFSAEDGRNTGAQIRTVTKSGTNRLHGGAVFQYDEPGLNAFNKYGGPNGQLPVRVGTKNRDIALSVGGPLIKDKLFGFFSFERFTLSSKSYSSQFVDTPQFRALIHTQRPGSLADQIANAAGGVPRIVTVLNQSCTSPFNLGTVAAGTCQVVNGGLDIGSPTGAKGTYASFNVGNQISAGNGLDGIPDVQYVQLLAPSSATGRQFAGRVDFQATPRDQVAGTFYYTKLFNNTSGASNSRPNADIPFNPRDMAATFIYIHTFAPSLLNEFRTNWTRFDDNGVTDAAASANGVNFGIPYINIQNQAFNSSNDVQYGIPFAPTTPGIFAENQYEIRDTVNKVFGGHTLKIGFEARREENNNNLAGGSRPGFAFAGMWNFFNDTPIFEEIYANPNTGGPGNSARHYHDHYYGVFVQHDWKLSPALTVNMGLRWEYFEPIFNDGSRVLYPLFGTTPGRELQDAQLEFRNHLYLSQYKNFAPKLGFAYSPPALQGKTVLRGGLALAYNRLDDVLFDPALEDGPGIFNFGVCCGTAPQDFGTPFVGGQIVYALGSSNRPDSYPIDAGLKTTLNSKNLPVDAKGNIIGIEVYGANNQLQTPYSYLYSMEVQQDLGHQLVMTVGYQGSNGRHYARLVNQNFVRANSTNSTNPFPNGAYIAQTDSNQYYNALNVHVVKRYRAGFSLDGTYSFAKAMDQISSGDGADGSANQTFPQNNSLELGPSDFDVKHRFTGIGTYELSPYHGSSELTRLAANGWQINGIFTAHTGFPWTPVTNIINGVPTLANQAVIGPIRPNSYTGSSNATCSNDAFKNGTSVNGVFGVIPKGNNLPGLGRNSFRGPCYQQIDLAVAKEFKFGLLGEQAGLRIQVQAFNAFNKLNLSPFVFNTSATQVDSGICTSGNIGNTAGCSTGTAVGTVVPGLGNFGKATSASAGRVVELNARFWF